MNIEPLSLADTELVASLMQEEEQAWLRELDWNYSPVRSILVRFLQQRLLPGFVATNGPKAAGYTYFLISRAKGMIGTVYASGLDAQHAADQILSRAIESLKDTRHLRRIEAQIIPLNGLDLDSIFLRHGFDHYCRHYMELDLATGLQELPDYGGAIVPWHSRYLVDCAALAYRSYRNGIDAVISEDYGSEASCEMYLGSLVDNPGCGIFLPKSSLVGLDSGGNPCGFVLTSQLSSQSAMVPQISIHPAHQGRGLGSALIRQALHQLSDDGYRTVRLTVSHQNRRAFEWYRRLGFRNRRDFGAYVWRTNQS
jgi:ribosomal protein S18 acetylase RimI-like enzyme